jgi:hypothetical protein
MSATRGPDQKPYLAVLTLHDRSDRSFLAFDLAHILKAFGSEIHRYMWVALPGLDIVPRAESKLPASFVSTAESGDRLFMSGQELLSLSLRIAQTIDGIFVGLPMGRLSPEQLEYDLDLSLFPDTNAQKAVRAVDSSFFEVYLKEPAHAELLRGRFSEVRGKDPGQFFSGAPAALRA